MGFLPILFIMPIFFFFLPFLIRFGFYLYFYIFSHLLKTYYNAYSNKECFFLKRFNFPLYYFCNRIYPPYRPSLSSYNSFTGFKLYKNYSSHAIYNFPIFQRLGLDPTFVHIHKIIIEKNHSIIKS